MPSAVAAAEAAGRHTLVSEPVNGSRGYARTKGLAPVLSGADTVRLTSFFSGRGGGVPWAKLKWRSGCGEPGFEASGLRAEGEEHAILDESWEPGEFKERQPCEKNGLISQILPFKNIF